MERQYFEHLMARYAAWKATREDASTEEEEATCDARASEYLEKIWVALRDASAK